MHGNLAKITFTELRQLLLQIDRVNFRLSAQRGKPARSSSSLDHFPSDKKKKSAKASETKSAKRNTNNREREVNGNKSKQAKGEGKESRAEEEVTCYRCQELGHYANKCPFKDAKALTKNLNRNLDRRVKVVSALKRIMKNPDFDADQLSDNEMEEILGALEEGEN